MKITVFTPTYNRAYIIENLYHSLQSQEYHDFEWLVIDDGSNDDTKSLFEKWMQEDNPFSIRYYYSENKGKQREINVALDLAQGELFFTVDSDDLLTSDALLKISNWANTIPNDGKFCAIAGSHGDMSANPVNPLFDGEYLDATFANRYAESGLFIGHDRPWVFYTNIHRKYKYPEFQSEKFITEAVAWNRMAMDGYKIRCFNDVIYLFEHREDGYTNSISQYLKDSPKGYGIWIKEQMDLLNYTVGKRMRSMYAFYCDMQDQYSNRNISEYLDVPIYYIFGFMTLYRIRHRRQRDA